LGFATNNASPQMVLDTNGNVGVGDSSPTKPLTLGTTTPVMLFDDQSSRTMEIRGPSTTHNATILTTYVADLLFGTNSTERMRIDSTGNVGVGATSMAAKFVVQDSSLPKIQSNYNGTKHLDMGNGGSGCGFAMTTGHFMTFNHQPYANRGTDTNLTERMRILSDGGITFNGDTATANALDDYEEGTWTPVYRDQSNASTLTITYDVQNGNYTKIGNTCIAHFSLGTDSVSGGSSSTYLAIGGLPFTSASDEARGSLIIGGKYSWPGNQPTQGSLFASNTIHNLWQGTSAAPNVATDQLGTGANSNRMHGTIIYKTA
jgi:hypothetical protein